MASTTATSPAHRLGGVASRQFGLFTRAQARSSGFSAYRIRRRIIHGEWQRVIGPVLTTAPRRIDPALRDVAAHLAVGGSVLAGPSAARRHGFPVADRTACLAVRPGCRSRLAGVRLLRDGLAAADVRLVDGMPVTSRSRTVFDCLRVLPERDAAVLLERALQAGWTTADELASRVVAFAGRHGAARLSALSRLAGSGAHSTAEQITARLLRQEGIVGWRMNVAVFDDAGLIGVGDVVFDGARLVVEVDGRDHHVTPELVQRDRRRQNRLVAAGWTVLRFTWHDITVRPGEVRTQVRAMVERLTWAPRDNRVPPGPVGPGGTVTPHHKGSVRRRPAS